MPEPLMQCKEDAQQEEQPDPAAYRFFFFSIVWLLRIAPTTTATVAAVVILLWTARRSKVRQLELRAVVTLDGNIWRRYLRITPQGEFKRLGD